ncbi:epl1 protein [Marasmius fiardii PR-910]|nr:epl1 protein [Marasmius fiardii PR-910]
MKFLTLLAFTTAALAVDVAWDSAYDDANGSMTSIACSDGDNGLITRFKFQTFSDVPSFPFVGGAPNIPSWNSPACGTCFQITYADASGFTKTVNFTGIDVGGNGFVTGQHALDQLTNGRAVELGIAPVNATVISPQPCGL